MTESMEFRTKRPQTGLEPAKSPFSAQNRRKNQFREPPALSLQGARRTDPRQRPHQHAQIISARVDQQPLADVRVPPQVHPPQPARHVHVRHRPLRLLRPLNAQLPAARAPHALPVRLHRRLHLFLARPVAMPRRGSATYDSAPLSSNPTITESLW